MLLSLAYPLSQHVQQQYTWIPKVPNSHSHQHVMCARAHFSTKGLTAQGIPHHLWGPGSRSQMLRVLTQPSALCLPPYPHIWSSLPHTSEPDTIKEGRFQQFEPRTESLVSLVCSFIPHVCGASAGSWWGTREEEDLKQLHGCRVVVWGKCGQGAPWKRGTRGESSFEGKIGKTRGAEFWNKYEVKYCGRISGYVYQTAAAQCSPTEWEGCKTTPWGWQWKLWRSIRPPGLNLGQESRTIFLYYLCADFIDWMSEFYTFL